MIISLSTSEIDEQLSRLIAENQSLDGSIDISDQSCMKDEILVLITQSNLRLLERLEKSAEWLSYDPSQMEPLAAIPLTAIQSERDKLLQKEEM